LIADVTADCQLITWLIANIMADCRLFALKEAKSSSQGKGQERLCLISPMQFALIAIRLVRARTGGRTVWGKAKTITQQSVRVITSITFGKR
jgi:hypothetical protein